jgi:hypothetical protein
MLKINHADVVPFEIPILDNYLTLPPSDILQFHQTEQALMFQAHPHILAPIEFFTSEKSIQTSNRDSLIRSQTVPTASSSSLSDNRDDRKCTRIEADRDLGLNIGNELKCSVLESKASFWDTVLGATCPVVEEPKIPTVIAKQSETEERTANPEPDRPFKCVRCNLRFRKRCNLLNHEKIVRKFYTYGMLSIVFFTDQRDFSNGE